MIRILTLLHFLFSLTIAGIYFFKPETFAEISGIQMLGLIRKIGLMYIAISSVSVVLFVFSHSRGAIIMGTTVITIFHGLSLLGRFFNYLDDIANPYILISQAVLFLFSLIVMTITIRRIY
jgi:hypothetical protein